MEGSSIDPAVQLRQSVVFGDLDEATLRRLAASLEPVDLPAGQILMSEGEPAHDAWILVTGRLVVSTGPAKAPHIVAEMGPGSLVGEMSLLSGSDRSATVTALRNCHLLRLPAAAFRRIVLEDPAVLLQVTRTVVRRLDRSIHRSNGASRPSVIAIVPAGSAPEHHEFAQQFAATPGRFRRVAAIDRSHVQSKLGASPVDSDLRALLHRVESDHDLTLLIADSENDAWTALCVKHADTVLLVGRAHGLSERNPAETVAVEVRPTHGRTERHLIIVGDARPRGTVALLRLRDVDRHHHVRAWSDSDIQRVARIISGSTVGLVFGGGGAKGFAHLGAVRALIEAGIPIDHVGGSSIGAVVAGIFALGWSLEKMVAMARMVTVDRGSLIDPSLPAVALASGLKLKRAVHDLYADTDIEDARIDFFCVSTDLSEGDLHVHTTGPMWQAVRASVGIPGIFPPVRSSEGRVLVDGGVLNNLPADVMRELFQPDVVIGSDVHAASRLPVEDLTADGVVSGWTAFGRRYAPRREPLQLPRITDLLTSASSATGRQGTNHADLVLAPPVEQYAILDFQAHAQIMEAGYRYAVEKLEAWNRPVACEPPLDHEQIRVRLGA